MRVGCLRGAGETSTREPLSERRDRSGVAFDLECMFRFPRKIRTWNSSYLVSIRFDDLIPIFLRRRARHALRFKRQSQTTNERPDYRPRGDVPAAAREPERAEARGAEGPSVVRCTSVLQPDILGYKLG